MVSQLLIPDRLNPNVSNHLDVALPVHPRRREYMGMPIPEVLIDAT
jgi:hypothetical protein